MSELTDRLSAHAIALRHMSFHGAPWSDNGVPFLADMTDDQVLTLVELLNEATVELLRLEAGE